MGVHHPQIEMNMPADIGGMMDDMMGSGYYGDQSQMAFQNNQMILEGIGISSDMITDIFLITFTKFGSWSGGKRILKKQVTMSNC